MVDIFILPNKVSHTTMHIFNWKLFLIYLVTFCLSNEKAVFFLPDKIMDLELQSLKHMQVFMYLQLKKNVFTTLTKI